MRDHWAGQYPLGKSSSGDNDSEDSDGRTPNAFAISQSGGGTRSKIWSGSSLTQYLTTSRALSPLSVRKATKWKVWVKVISPVLLRGRQPEPSARNNCTCEIYLGIQYAKVQNTYTFSPGTRGLQETRPLISTPETRQHGGSPIKTATWR